jgi:chromosome segregation ATPase
VKGDVEQADESPSIRNGVHNLSLDSDSAPKDSTEVSGLAEKVEVLAKERDNLRLEVAELRKSLEDIQGNHKQEIDDLKAKLETAEEGREEADQRHSDLRVRVKEITATLGERLKSNTVQIPWSLLAHYVLMRLVGGNLSSEYSNRRT